MRITIFSVAPVGKDLRLKVSLCEGFKMSVNSVCPGCIMTLRGGDWTKANIV